MYKYAIRNPPLVSLNLIMIITIRTPLLKIKEILSKKLAYIQVKAIVYRITEYASDFMHTISIDLVYITQHDCLNFLKVCEKCTNITFFSSDQLTPLKILESFIGPTKILPHNIVKFVIIWTKKCPQFVN